MTTAQRFYLPIPQLFTDLGTLAPGWKLYFYQTGTTTPLSVYSNTALTVALPNPVLTNNEGYLIDGSNNITSIYFSDASLYKAVLKNENDIEIWTADPCDPFSVSLANLTPRPLAYAGSTSGTSSAYILTANPPFAAYSSNDIFELTFHTPCAAAPTLQYVATGAALNLKKRTGQGTKVALLANDVEGRHQVTNDGTDIIVLDPRTQMLYLGAPPTVTIAAGIGVLPNSASNYLFETEGSAATDDLDTINGGVDGQKIAVGNVNDARNIIVKHNTGNIFNPAGIDVVLDVTSNKIEMIYSAALSKWIITSAFSLTPILNIQDQKVSGTSGGVSSSNFNTRVLNTVVKNTISGASLATNTITLPAGTYEVLATAPAYAAGPHQLFFYNSSDSTTVLIGSSQSMGGGGNANSEHSTVFGVFTIATSKNFILRHWIRDAIADGLGAAVSTGLNEVYAQTLIKKIG